MVLSRGVRSSVAGLLLAAAVGRGAEFKVPPLAGELAGDITPLKIADAPTLHWTLALQNGPAGARTVQLRLDGSGTHLRGEAQLDAAGGGTWRVSDGDVDFKPWLGGQVTAGAAAVAGEGTVQAGAWSGDFILHVRDLDLGELLRFADPDKKYFQSAKGRVEGTVRVQLRAGEFSRGDIVLAVPPGTTALVLFQPSPGLLSSYVPAMVRRIYNGIEAIELGRTPLEASVLRLSYSPLPDAAGLSALIHLEGRPQDRKYTAPLVLDLPFRGEVDRAVDDFLQLHLKLGGAK